MRLLLDTHVVLWWLDASPRLSAAAGAAIRGRENESIVSAAVIWEVSIKRALRKLRAPPALLALVRSHGFTVLALSGEHADAVGELPPHHRDPFDRLLIAQALADGLTLVSADATMARYGVPVVW